MPNFFQQFLNQVGSGYKEADKRLGGWLPGGGTAAPPVSAFQAAAPIAGRLASKIRDEKIIPVIDKGIETGALPTKEAMFARYLTGTSKPLTVYPQPLIDKISTTFEPENTVVGTQSAYTGGTMPEDVAHSLGRFNIKDNVIYDRYKFDDLEKGRQPAGVYLLPGGLQIRNSVYADAAAGGNLASDLIELGLKTGIITPSSGYDVRVPYKK